MTVTYEAIATTTLGSNQASYTFSSIPGTFTDLVLVSRGTTAAGGTDRGLLFRVNSDTGSNYSYTNLDGNGTSASSDRGSNDVFGIAGLISSSTQSVSIAQFFNYANTTTNKTILARGNNAGARVRASVSLWRSTSAINSITIFDSANDLSSGSTFTLYGIKAE